MFVYTSPLWVAAIVPLMVRSERLRPVQWAGVVLAGLRGHCVRALREGFVIASAAGDAALVWRSDLLALIAGALGADHGGDPDQRPDQSVGREAALLSSGGERRHACRSYPTRWVRHGRSRLAALRGSRWLQTVVGAFASYLAWMWLLGRYPATRVSVFVFLTPLFAIPCSARGG